ncbi:MULTISPECIES: DNA cytosine methyltransferase [Paraburkholderia]|uniref:DNA cytosine methyltransferase n=1 Tax=Paraburkholderia podalyriae TaxID=1938811 RepID=A0ABR7PVN8_9BURK|nr:DNA cytosine methyltransferase [Paraburkholderia podalyriae]MBC8750322.1 DNA cytosine methyltransferase [Paraburkholderia podalyriae]
MAIDGCGANTEGGDPPCQPFSNGGRAAGPKDERDMWPEAIRAVREMQPKAFLFENVRGLLRPAFSEYLDHILQRLERGGFEGPLAAVLPTELRRELEESSLLVGAGPSACRGPCRAKARYDLRGRRNFRSDRILNVEQMEERYPKRRSTLLRKWRKPTSWRWRSSGSSPGRRRNLLECRCVTTVSWTCSKHSERRSRGTMMTHPIA